MKDESMRKGGENSIKPPPGKAAIRSTKNNDFTLGVGSQTFACDEVLFFQLSYVDPLGQLRSVELVYGIQTRNAMTLITKQMHLIEESCKIFVLFLPGWSLPSQR
jgi:hypothetical protein